MKDIRKPIIELLFSLPEEIHPVRISNPVTTGDGLEYGLLGRSVQDPRHLALFDSNNGPDTNPTEMPLGQFKESELALMLADAMSAMEERRYSKRARLLEDMEEIADAIADECGQNVPYVASIDLSEFPFVIELLEDKGWDEKEKETILSTCRFLAENGNKFPVEMKNASFEEFRAYALEHEDIIIKEIRGDVEYDYEDATGRPFRESAADEDARTPRENEGKIFTRSSQ